MLVTTEGRTVVLPPVLDIAAAAPLRETLLGLRGGPATLDASGVERLGGLCLQILMAARLTWAADGFAFSLSRASEAFRRQLVDFGAGDLQRQAMEDRG